MSDEPRKIVYFVIGPVDPNDDPAVLRAVEEAMRSALEQPRENEDNALGAIPPDAVRDEALEAEIIERVSPRLVALARARQEALNTAHHAQEFVASVVEFSRVASAEATIAARARLRRAVAAVNEHVMPRAYGSILRITEGIIIALIVMEIARAAS